MESVLKYIRQILLVTLVIFWLLFENYISEDIQMILALSLYIIGTVSIIIKRFLPFEGVRIKSINHTAQVMGSFSYGFMSLIFFILALNGNLFTEFYGYYFILFFSAIFSIIYILHAVLYFPRGYIKKAGTDSLKVSGIGKAIEIKNIEVFKFHMQYIRIKLKSNEHLKSERYYFDQAKISELLSFLGEILPTESTQLSDELKEAMAAETV